MTKPITGIFAGIAALAIASPLLAAQPVTGRWITTGGKALVEIAPCGAMLCGKVIQVLKPGAAANSKLTPGFIILSDMTDAGAYWKGTIHLPQNGKSFGGKVSRNPDRSLKIQGCIAFICKTQIWTAAR